VCPAGWATSRAGQDGTAERTPFIAAMTNLAQALRFRPRGHCTVPALGHAGTFPVARARGGGRSCRTPSSLPPCQAWWLVLLLVTSCCWSRASLPDHQTCGDSRHRRTSAAPSNIGGTVEHRHRRTSAPSNIGGTIEHRRHHRTAAPRFRLVARPLPRTHRSPG
jgi:hypothetical protein